MGKLKVFFDTNVLLNYFKGDNNLKYLFSEELIAEADYYISPIIIQELLSVKKLFTDDSWMKFINSKFSIIHKENVPKINDFLERIKETSEFNIHTNDVLALHSAIEFSCDYFITYDKSLKRIRNTENLMIVSPNEFLEVLRERK